MKAIVSHLNTGNKRLYKMKLKKNKYPSEPYYFTIVKIVIITLSRVNGIIEIHTKYDLFNCSKNKYFDFEEFFIWT